MPNNKILIMSVGIGHRSDIGVAIAQYSCFRSRMWAWHAQTLEVIGFQDVRAGVRLLDVSETGTYCAYHATSCGQKTAYMAISKPPYFTALWIRNHHTSWESEVRFESKSRIFYSTNTGRDQRYTDVKERTEAGCPFLIQAYSNSSRESREASPRVIVDYLYASASTGRALTDPCRRKIGLEGSQLCADGVPFVDCTRTPLVQVPPAEWAKRW